MFEFLKKKKQEPKQEPIYYNRPLFGHELAIAALVFCLTTHRNVPDDARSVLENMPTVLLRQPYRKIVELYQTNPNALEEIEVLFTVLLEQTLKNSRKKNKDYVVPASTVSEDIYDRIGV